MFGLKSRPVNTSCGSMKGRLLAMCHDYAMGVTWHLTS